MAQDPQGEPAERPAQGEPVEPAERPAANLQHGGANRAMKRSFLTGSSINLLAASVIERLKHAAQRSNQHESGRLTGLSLDHKLRSAKDVSRVLRRRIRSSILSTGVILALVALAAALLDESHGPMWFGIVPVSPLIAAVSLRAVDHRLVLSLCLFATLLFLTGSALFAWEVGGWFDGSMCAATLAGGNATNSYSSSSSSGGVIGTPVPSVCLVLLIHGVCRLVLALGCLLSLLGTLRGESRRLYRGRPGMIGDSEAVPTSSTSPELEAERALAHANRAATASVRTPSVRGQQGSPPTRVRLQRLFLVGRIFVGVDGLLQVLTYGFVAIDATLSAHVALMQVLGGCIQVVGALAVSPRARRRVHAYLSRMGVHAEAREASVIAALIGHKSPELVLRLARDCFRTIAWDRLQEVGANAGRLGVFADSNLAGTSDLHSRTVKTELGSADAFLSQYVPRALPPPSIPPSARFFTTLLPTPFAPPSLLSCPRSSWRDDGASKWAVLSRWCNDFGANAGRPPRLFFDRACIDQTNIDDNLACLPVHLAGCVQLLVLAGSTYCTRLWCLMELFTFVKMGGSAENVTVVPLVGGSNADASGHGARFAFSSEETFKAEVVQLFSGFDANRAQCFVQSERQRLLGIIEAGFGSIHDFNATVRDILAGIGGVKRSDKLAREIQARLRGYRLWQCAAHTIMLSPNRMRTKRRRVGGRAPSAALTGAPGTVKV